MDLLKTGDRVTTDTGDSGTVVHVARHTAFVKLDSETGEDTVKAFLVSNLTKIEPPNAQFPSPP